jgi:hypothetical protein
MLFVHQLFAELPDQESSTFWTLAIPFLIIVLRISADRWDRANIRDELQRLGCTLHSIHWDPFGAWWLGKGKRSYQVVYVTRSGREKTGTCVVSAIFGIKWLSDSPAGHESQTADTLRAIERDNTTESSCLSCGSVMRSNVTQCPRCGWTYE